MLGARPGIFIRFFTFRAAEEPHFWRLFLYQREEVKPRMGRKKSNARIQPHGKRIHVNKYINKRGRTRRKSAAAYNRSVEKQQESS